jgi:spore coat protein A
MAGAATLIPGGRSAAVTSDFPPLEPFVDPLPIPPVLPPRTGVIPGGHFYEVRMLEFKQKLHRDLPATTLWGYEGMYPGPTIRAVRNVPVFVRWVNALRDLATGALRTTHILPIDLCLHGPDHFGNVPHTVVHLHGGRMPPDSDGHPNATIVPGQRVTYHYPNAQRGMTLWYHDHTWGITRLNVYMGLAGFYLIDDPAVEGPLNLPSGEFDVPLVIQDRAFNADGSLKYPATWAPIFLGDRVLVNGKVQPFLNVKRGKYRFRLLNACNSRVLRLAISPAGPPGTMTQIATEGGLIQTSVPLTEIPLAPAERVEVVIDFGLYGPGTQVTLVNIENPDPPDPAITSVMRFVVGSAIGHTAPVPGPLATVEVLDEADAVETRLINFTFDTVPCKGGRFSFNHLGWNDVTEFPKLGTTEIWEFKSEGAGDHPIHMHLVHFQVLGRQPLAGSSSPTTGQLRSGHPHAFQPDGRGGFLPPVTRGPGPLTLAGPYQGAHPHESGWKDTVMVPNDTITRVIARFEGYTGHYPYHCHILEHEDHQMMRQFRVDPP